MITRTRNASWRTTFAKIIVRPGLLPWGKPFQNLRASQEMELAQRYPLHVVTAWIGNSIPVAAKHYLQVTDADFARAAKSDAESDARTTQNTTQTAADVKRPERTQLRKVLENQAFRPVVSAQVLLCPSVQYTQQESNL
ncbi:MAG: hypothetical protein C0467_09070 [Planctomycetaceae bacterium]|nr:hypothetical protein [Planctomycetaceae bacterium]